MFRNLLQRRLNRKSRPITRKPQRSYFRPRLEALEERTLLSASMVTDLNTRTDGSYPTDMANLNGKLYFMAVDNAHQMDLFQNGANGPTMIKTIMAIDPGYNSGSGQYVSHMTVAGNRLFFLVQDQLWTSDGTATGTKSLGAAGFYRLTANEPSTLAFNGDFYFTSYSDANGRELWKSDGTSVTRVNTGTSALDESSPQLVAGNGVMYFVAGNSTDGESIWQTDGTTTQALNLGSTPFASIRGLTAVNGALDFFANTPSSTYPANPFYLYQYSNGTTAKIDSTTAFNPYSYFETAAVNNQLFFTAEPPSSYSTNLWTVSGTGTPQIQSLGSAAEGFGQSLHNANGRLVFLGSDRTLWTSDGTTAGTKSLGVSSYDSQVLSPQESATYNGSLYFEVKTLIPAASGLDFQLWRTDGTSAELVKDFGSTAGEYANYRFYPTIAGNTLYLAAGDADHGVELWQSDGSAAGTSLVADIYTNTLSSYPQRLTDVNGTLYFTARTGLDPLNGQPPQLFKSDGTAAGTSVVPGTPSLGGYGLLRPTNVSGTLFYIRVDPSTNDTQLWKTDGTTSKEVYGFGSGGVDQVIAVGNTVFVSFFKNGVGGELWAFDQSATLATTSNSAPLMTNIGVGSNVVFNGKLYFASYGGHLWVSDGTAAGTHRANLGNPDTNVTNLMVDKNTLSFFDGQQLWKTDGTTATLAASIGSFYRVTPIDVNGTLYFVTADYYDYYGSTLSLWKSDTGGATRIATVPVSGLDFGNSLGNMAVVGNRLFFDVYVNGGREITKELWTSDGTTAGTQMVKHFEGIYGFYNPNYVSPDPLTSLDGKLYFTAKDSGRDSELWESDGTAAGTYMVQNIFPNNPYGAIAYDPELTVSNGRLYFSANDGTHGYELWAFDPATHFQISVSAGVPLPGIPFTVTVKALDQFGKVDSDFRGAVHFASSDGSIDFDHTFTAGAASTDNGVYSFTVTLPAGTQTITASGSIRGSLTLTIPVEVTNQIGIASTELSYDPTTQLSSGQIILTQGVGQFNGPLDLLLQGLTPGVQLQSVSAVIDGVSYNLSIETDDASDPVIIIPADVLSLLQGHQVLRIEVQYFNPNDKQIDYTPRAFADE